MFGSTNRVGERNFYYFKKIVTEGQISFDGYFLLGMFGSLTRYIVYTYGTQKIGIFILFS